MRPLLTVFAFLALCGGAAFSDENLVEKREKCQAESRQRIKPHGRVTADLSKTLLAKRQDYVRACMDGNTLKPRKRTP